MDYVISGLLALILWALWSVRSAIHQLSDRLSDRVASFSLKFDRRFPPPDDRSPFEKWLDRLDDDEFDALYPESNKVEG